MLKISEKELLKKVPKQLFIDGEWCGSASKATLEVRDPSNDNLLAIIADATSNDGIKALEAADNSQAAWSRTPARVRGELLRAAFERVQELKDEFALLITLEMGKPISESLAEVQYGSEFLRWFSEEAVRVTGRYGANPEGTGRNIISLKPVGPSFLVTPWNFPFAMATRKIGPALAAGCSVVIKPASLTPLTTLYFVKILSEVGVPPGVVNVVTSSDSATISSRILADSRLRKLSFTGSTSVGISLMKQAADNVLRTSMELGGNAPFIVFEDADLELALEGAIVAKFRNIGQACTGANRFLVHSQVAETFTSMMTKRVNQMKMGRGTEDGVTIGPLIDRRAVEKCHALVEDAVARGAKITTGGEKSEGIGTFYKPTVLTNVKPGSQILNEEIFGPVVSIITFDSEEEAVNLANETQYGLASYVYTQDFSRGQRLIESIEAGMMGLNIGVLSNASAPFGGVKMSGLGREGGAEGIHEYLSIKYTMTPNPFS